VRHSRRDETDRNFKQIQTSSNVIPNVKWLCGGTIPGTPLPSFFYLSFSSPARFLNLYLPVERRCNGSGAVIKTVTSDSPATHTHTHTHTLSSPEFLRLTDKKRFVLSVRGAVRLSCGSHVQFLRSAFSLPPLPGVPSANALIRLLRRHWRWGGRGCVCVCVCVGGGGGSSQNISLTLH